jgi:hypothetical protein
MREIITLKKENNSKYIGKKLTLRYPIIQQDEEYIGRALTIKSINYDDSPQLVCTEEVKDFTFEVSNFEWTNENITLVNYIKERLEEENNE